MIQNHCLLLNLNEQPLKVIFNVLEVRTHATYNCRTWCFFADIIDYKIQAQYLCIIGYHGFRGWLIPGNSLDQAANDYYNWNW